MSGLLSEVKRLDFDYEEEHVEVTPKITRPNLRLDGIHYNLVENRPTRLPYWIAQILVDQNLATIDGGTGESFKLIKYLYQEQSSKHNLVELDTLTYRLIIKDLEELNKNFTSSGFIKSKTIRINFNKLIVDRTKKILDLVRTDSTISNSNMSAEEYWFYNRMNNIYREWKVDLGTRINPNQDVEVHVLQSIDAAYDVSMNENGTFEKVSISLNEGDTIKIPLYLAEIFEDQRKVVISSRGFNSPEDLERIVEREKQNTTYLTEIEPLLFYFIRSEIKTLRDKQSDLSIMKSNAYEGRLNFILRLRTRKILKQFSDKRVELGNMTPEEESLHNEITELYAEWKMMLGEEIFEGDR